jgi:hypothetical protein
LTKYLAGAAILVAIAAVPAIAQEASATFPFGTPVVVLPVQSVEPSPDGSWPAHAATGEEALRAMDAELEFALADRRGAENWAFPSDLRRRIERNPILDVNPDRLAYQGLIQRPDARDQIYEPLHGELRTLAALFGTRFLMLPLRLQVERIAQRADSEVTACREDAAPQRASLLVALIDIRRSAVIWHGHVAGGPVCPESGALLASLATVIAREIAE